MKLSTLDTKDPIDFNNLTIITHPKPPRRRQSGATYIPFRPYVKCLNSIRQQHSFTDGKASWLTQGKDEIFFTQQNARCIGTLLDDCGISDSIRLDIEAESTKLPMMCKLWIIVDGAVVERGKAHMVQDAAIQVHTGGRSRRNLTLNDSASRTTTYDRRRRQSWHDISEYRSVPYYQYSRPAKDCPQTGVQCNRDLETPLSMITETSDDTKLIKEEKIVTQEKKSIMTQTESTHDNSSTQTNFEYVHFYHLLSHQSTAILSSMVDPVLYHHQSHLTAESYSWETTETFRNGVRYNNVFVSTGDDYPKWWIQVLSTASILSEKSINVQEQQSIITMSSPRMQEQGVQTERKQSRQQSSSSLLTEKNLYDDFDENNHTRMRTNSGYSSQNEHLRSKTNSRLSDYYSSDLDGNLTTANNNKRADQSSSRLSDYLSIKEEDGQNKNSSSSQTHSPSRGGGDHLDYKQFELSLNTLPINNHHSLTRQSDVSLNLSSSHILRSPFQRSSTTAARNRTSSEISTILDNRQHRTGAIIATKWEPTSTSILIDDKMIKRETRSDVESDDSYVPSLSEIDRILEIYRQQALLEISQRSNIDKTNMEMELYTGNEHSIRSSRHNSVNVIPSQGTIATIATKYRSIKPTSQDMINAYMDERCTACIPRLLTSRLEPSLALPPISELSLIKPEYVELNYNNYWSPWIAYNEQRVNDLQKRIELLLQIDDDQDLLTLTAPSLISSSNRTVTQHIDDILLQDKYNDKHHFLGHRALTYPSTNSKSSSSITHANGILNYPSYSRYSPHFYRLRAALNYTALPENMYHALPISPRFTQQKSVRIGPVTHLKSTPVSPRSADHSHHRLKSTSRSVLHKKPPTHYHRSILRSTAPHMNTSHIWQNSTDGLTYVLQQWSIPRYYRLYDDVGFRDMYRISLLMNPYLDQADVYSNIAKNYLFEQVTASS
ncbi:unnamed protein product [Didymodactylos carnosus]|uniref:Uncharacterized protein n=1 Tax=Didymodactylos carnosus TaxID=1234261 RepID=A0A813PSU9_9BILA|nr:unnamed protein product [Didymodactylos carnosus]CAF1252459.1 unnamed protein product [Didymodactylos carnosus]CAF3535834.1 unnamed protein product [Didymodactylos carnosus]CAF4059581.1 unnamed protein product [Didymodactylos carnosus]